MYFVVYDVVVKKFALAISSPDEFFVSWVLAMPYRGTDFHDLYVK